VTNIRVWLFHVAIATALICCSPCRGQVGIGTPAYGTFGGGPDVINLGNLNSHITVPMVNKPGRGLPLVFNLSYDSSVWYPALVNGTTTWQPVSDWGWASVNATLGSASYQTSFSNSCAAGNYTEYFGWSYQDPLGVVHPFPGSPGVYSNPNCGTDPVTWTATDGSGYTLKVYAVPNTSPQTFQITATSSSGQQISTNLQNVSGPGSIEDRNGNFISVSSTGFTDTLGISALTVSGTAPNPITFTYKAPSGANASYTLKYTTQSVETKFGCTGVTEYSATNVPLVSEIDLPDGTKYTFTYEETTSGQSSPVTGRLASYTLPSGGTISYTYTGSNGGIQCSDGSAAGLTRTVNPGGVWEYARSGSGTAWTTTITDPSSPSNTTVINFQSNTAGAGIPTRFYETERNIYQGSPSGTLLKTVYTCYNGATSPCNSTAISIPITERTVLIACPGTGGLVSKRNTSYNSNSLVTEADEYAYGVGVPGSLVRKTLTTYATLGNGINNLPASVTIEDGSSNIHSQTTYTYDQGSVTSTTSTPQHVSISGSRGNATTVSYLVQTSTTLSKTYTYYDTGNILSATDVNGAQTTFTYGTSSCGNSFATSVSEPLSLSRSMVWNCTGGVETSVTDENGKTVSTTYNDPDFWRPNKLTDQESNLTNITYTHESSTETSLLFNSSTSTSDVLSSLDGLGRRKLSQVLEAPGSSTYDSVETDYDALGRPEKMSLPYSGSAGQTSSNAPGTTTTYDALSRQSRITDSGGRSVTFTYAQNDTYRTIGPAPTGENAKRQQFEYDAQGRLTSVCEITSATGSGPCAQTSPATGYWTTYTYDAMNRLLTVTQNAQSSGSHQTRTFAYDDLGRMTSEINPESGTTSYTFDTGATCGTSKGDLVKKIDAVGNTTCLAYDSLHRPTSITYSGPYSSSTPNKYFVYDAATVNGVAMTNVKARMAEAYTATSSTGTKITDIGLSYTSRGESSDVYESTPHSGGYYHTSATYWPNGALSQLGNNIATLPVFNYGADGEGRSSTVSATAGQNPVTGTSYSVASLATQVNLGSSDSDSFTYDPNSNRMTQYKFTVNGQSVVGALTWSAIGTLENLSITDPFFSSGNQSCVYTHDDETRIASANCGTVWSQTFSYDAFGNLSKSGTVSFQPTYSYLTNHMTEIGSSVPTYDANGNVTNDFLHTYTWDAAGRPVMTDAVGITYDALERIVERNTSGAYTEVVYATNGNKLAIMNAQTLQKAFIPLTGGAVAVYNSSGLEYYRHPDWLGSSRFASTSSRAMFFDGAYAPFGEPYAETGSNDLSFTGMNQDTTANLYDFPDREYGVQGRWPSPDPAGLSSVGLNDPQTWNRYAYVRNSPLSLVDPLGLDCAYLNSTGTGLDENGIDTGSNQAECSQNNGFWGDGSIIGIGLNAGNNNVDIYTVYSDPQGFIGLELTPNGTDPYGGPNWQGAPVIGNLDANWSSSPSTLEQNLNALYQAGTGAGAAVNGETIVMWYGGSALVGGAVVGGAALWTPAVSAAQSAWGLGMANAASISEFMAGFSPYVPTSLIGAAGSWTSLSWSTSCGSSTAWYCP
jgi:RHS repeat-associated protein